MTRRGKAFVVAILIPIVIGAIGLANVIARPRFAAFHTVDVLQLLLSGACFGVAFSALMVIIRKPPQ